MLIDVKRLSELASLWPHQLKQFEVLEVQKALPDLLAVYEAACAWKDAPQGRRILQQMDLEDAIDSTRSKS